LRTEAGGRFAVQRGGGQTMNRSVVTAKIAGIESTANVRSENPTSSSTTNSGVARRTPFSRTKNWSAR
jgi:hypothetical protein